MKWKHPRRHFFDATRQLPAPVEGDFFEWDYSRYSRALGMTPQPGLNHQPYACFGLVGGAPELWQRMRAEYGRWARAAGWKLMVVQARPTVAVPDPVVYALGVEASGEGEMIFFRSGQSGEPVLRPRVRLRSEGCSLPVVGGERWLMAADRVRRRARDAIAERGLVLFIEEAEYLTASAFNVLRYLGNAHRAWRARMLSRDARIYVVLATRRCHETRLRRMFDRLHVSGEIPLARRRRPPEEERERLELERMLAESGREGRRELRQGAIGRNGTAAAGAAASAGASARAGGGADAVAETREPRVAGPRQPHAVFGVEEEHLLAGINAAPYVLAESDVLRIFGTSNRQRIDDLVARGVLVRRVEAGTVCLAVAAEYAADLPACPVRVIEAILENYRSRDRRREGHHHLPPALARLYFRVGKPRQAIVTLGRMIPGYSATVPLVLADELSESLDSATELTPHASHHASHLAIRTHLHDYQKARDLADRIVDRPIRTPRDLARLLHQLFSTGKHHMHRLLGDRFWSSLSTPLSGEDAFDLLCVGCETFTLPKPWGLEDLLYRAEVLLCTAVSPNGASAVHPEALGRLHAMEKLLRIAFAAMLESHPEVDSTRFRYGAEWATIPIARIARNTVLPAVLLGSTLHWKRRIRCQGRETLVEGTYADAVRLTAASGHPIDTQGIRSTQLALLHSRHLRLLLGGLADERILVLDALYETAKLRFVAATLCSLSGYKQDTHAQLCSRALGQPGFSRSRLIVHGSMMIALSFMAEGDISEALAWQHHFAQQGTRSSVLFAQSLLVGWYCSWMTLDPEANAYLRQLLTQAPPGYPKYLRDYWDSVILGGMSLEGGAFRHAAHHFQSAAENLEKNESGHGPLRALSHMARAKAGCARVMQAAKEAAVRGTTSRAQSLRDMVLKLRRAHRMSFDAGRSVSLRTCEIAREILLTAEHVGVEHSAGQGTDALQIAIWVWQAMRAHHRRAADFLLERMAAIAPRLTAQLRSALADCLSQDNREHPEGAFLQASLSMLAKVTERKGAEKSDPMSLHAAFPMASENEVWARCSSVRRAAVDMSGAWEGGGTSFRKLGGSLMAIAKDGTTSCLTISAYAVMPLGIGHAGREVINLRVCGRPGGWARISREVYAEGREARPTAPTGTRKRHLGRKGKANVRASGASGAEAFLGVSEAAVTVRQNIEAAASCAHPILILGETGVGKEVVARAIHALSQARRRPFVVADCASTAEGVLYSDLFGHERGAFSGAVVSRVGLLESVRGGTLFLDELNSMRPPMQAALLRAIECKEIRPLGSSQMRVAEFRLVSAGFPDLPDLVKRGEFREDLFYRIGAFKLYVPPLRSRPEDVEFLAAHFADGMGVTLTPAALQRICGLPWKGNVRELKNTLRAASVLGGHRVIDLAVLDEVLGREWRSGDSPASTRSTRVVKAWQAYRATIMAGERFRRAQFAATLSLKVRTAQRYLRVLVGHGVLRRSGTGRATEYWESTCTDASGESR